MADGAELYYPHGVRASAPLGLTLVVACSGSHFVGSEPWVDPPELRIAVVARGSEVSVHALDGDQRREGELVEAPNAELWLFSYRLDTLRRAFPGFASSTREEIIAALAPVVGNGGEEPPEADEVLRASVGEGFANPIAYAPQTWAEWEARRGTGLAFTLQIPNEKVCGVIEVTRIDGPPGIELKGVEVIEPDRLFVTARATRSDPSLRIYTLEGAELRHVFTRTERAGSVCFGVRRGGDCETTRPSWDPRTGTFWDVDELRQLVRFKPDGSPEPVPAPPTEPSGGGFDDARVRPEAVRVAAGSDGSVFATFIIERIEEGRTTFSPHLYRRTSSGWVEAQEGLQQRGGFDFLRVVTGQRLVSYYRCWIYYYADPNESTGWKQSLLEEGCATGFHETMRDVDLDEDGGVAVGNNGFVYLRDDAINDWTRTDQGLPRVNYETATAIRGGAALITDELGKIYVHRGRRWCEVANPLERPFEHGAAAPNLQVAYLLAKRELTETPSAILRVELK